MAGEGWLRSNEKMSLGENESIPEKNCIVSRAPVNRPNAHQNTALTTSRSVAGRGAGGFSSGGGGTGVAIRRF